MKKNKFLLTYAVRLATLCAVLALVLFIPASMTESNGLRIFLIVWIALLGTVGCVFLYLAQRQKGERYHYFLYDHRRRKVLPKSELSADLIREGMDRYLSSYTEDVASLWNDIPKRLRIQLEGDAAFRPLVAYRMLLELSGREPEDILSRFKDADDRAVGYLCRAIRDGGDADMADFIFDLKKNSRREQTRIPGFFRKNHRFFEESMLYYTERNMGAFYMDKARIEKE